MTILAARPPGDSQQPRLRLKKQPDGTLEITLRDAEAAAAAAATAQAAALPGGLPPSALAPKAWAWPLPLLGLSDWVPYESLLRSILSAHPLTLQKGLNQGLALRLTKSSIKGVSLVHFDMELRAPAAVGEVFPPADGFLNMEREWRLCCHNGFVSCCCLQHWQLPGRCVCRKGVLAGCACSRYWVSACTAQGVSLVHIKWSCGRLLLWGRCSRLLMAS